MSFQTRKNFVRLRNTIKDMLDENRDACDCPVDCIVNCIVKVQKSRTQKRERCLYPAGILQNESEETNSWIKCSRRFIKFRLNHWWQMDYSDDAFHTFLDLDSAIYYAVNWTVTSIPVVIQHILKK